MHGDKIALKRFREVTNVGCLSKRQTKDPDSVTYSHAAVTPVLVRPGEARVIALPPEFIAREDGQEKQDSEIKASSHAFIEAPLPPLIDILKPVFQPVNPGLS